MPTSIHSQTRVQSLPAMSHTTVQTNHDARLSAATTAPPIIAAANASHAQPDRLPIGAGAGAAGAGHGVLTPGSVDRVAAIADDAAGVG